MTFKEHPYMATVVTGLILGLGFGGLWIGFVIIGCFMVVGAGFVYYMKAVFAAMNKAKAGVPSPQQIRQHFVQTQGREPTVEEVNALHAMLVREHNQALVNVGILGVGLYGANRALHGKPFL